MPATTPSFGIPKVAVVMARLIVSGQDRGCRFFIVPICNKFQMYRGVRSTRLPRRSGTSPLDFSVTTFDNVLLPTSALLGDSLEAPKNPLQAWWGEVWRIPIGTGAVVGPFVQALKHAAYIGSSYSLHRHVVGKTPTPVPLMSFWTQRWAMVQAVAVSRILDVWYPIVVRQSIDKALSHSVRHAYSVIAKAGIVRLFQPCLREVIERCGAQGWVDLVLSIHSSHTEKRSSFSTFEHNFMARLEVRQALHCSRHCCTYISDVYATDRRTRRRHRRRRRPHALHSPLQRAHPRAIQHPPTGPQGHPPLAPRRGPVARRARVPCDMRRPQERES